MDLYHPEFLKLFYTPLLRYIVNNPGYGTKKKKNNTKNQKAKTKDLHF